MGWTTRDEIAFIDGLGTFNNRKVAPTPSDRYILLQGYKTGIHRRVLWNGVDRLTVISHLAIKLSDLEKEMK